jgi:hypothetical protein
MNNKHQAPPPINRTVAVIIILGILLATVAMYECGADQAQTDLVKSQEESPWHALLCFFIGPKSGAY